MERRDFIKSAAGFGAAAILAGSCSRLDFITDENDDFSGDEFFSFAHITDQHVQAERHGDEGYLECVNAVKKERPELVVMGGDMAFDGNYHEKSKFIRDVKLYKEISDELGVPYFHCMGNHDTLGLSPRRKVSVNDPDFGKKAIMDLLEWPSSYYSFDYKGWHFVVLDCMHVVKDDEHGPIYHVEIDPEQMEWLAADLGTADGRPIVAFTHVAAFCNIGQINANPDIKAMNHMVLNNTKELRLLLERHKVKALIQGHSHMIENYRFNGVWYITSAAASAAWWGGNWLGFKPGYTMFTCKGDELLWEHKTYQWEAKLEPEDNLERERNVKHNKFLAEQKKLRKEEILAGKDHSEKKIPLSGRKLHVMR